MTIGSAILRALFYLCVLPMTLFLTVFYLVAPIDPFSSDILFDVTHSSFTDFNFTATTNIDGTNNFHYRYNLSLNIRVRKLDNNYDFVHYDDVKVMAFHESKRFAMVDLSSFYSGKELTNTTDLLSLTHSLIGEYDVLVIDPPPVDRLNLSDNHGGAAAIIDDNMVAQLYFSVSPPRSRNTTYMVNYSKEELEFKCELELTFPLLNGKSAQHTNTSTLETIDCDPYFLAYSCKYYLYHGLLVLALMFIGLALLFIGVIIGVFPDDLPDNDPKIHDNIPLKQPLLQG